MRNELPLAPKLFTISDHPLAKIKMMVISLCPGDSGRTALFQGRFWLHPRCDAIVFMQFWTKAMYLP